MEFYKKNGTSTSFLLKEHDVLDQILAAGRPEKCHTVRELTEELAVKEL
jgi:hypothetical protein